MQFRKHYLDLTVAQRNELAASALTTRGTLNQIVYGDKRIELGLADCLVALCPGVTLDDLPLTQRATAQRRTRERAVEIDANPATAALKSAVAQEQLAAGIAPARGVEVARV